MHSNALNSKSYQQYAYYHASYPEGVSEMSDPDENQRCCESGSLYSLTDP